MIEPKNAEEAVIFAIEELVAETQYCIQKVMNLKSINRSELARRLGCSPANVTQMLSEDSNLRLDTVAKIFHALGDECILKSKLLEEVDMQDPLSMEGQYILYSDFADHVAALTHKIAPVGHYIVENLEETKVPMSCKFDDCDSNTEVITNLSIGKNAALAA